MDRIEYTFCKEHGEVLATFDELTQLRQLAVEMARTRPYTLRDVERVVCRFPRKGAGWIIQNTPKMLDLAQAQNLSPWMMPWPVSR